MGEKERLDLDAWLGKHIHTLELIFTADIKYSIGTFSVYTSITAQETVLVTRLESYDHLLRYAKHNIKQCNDPLIQIY